MTSMEAAICLSCPLLFCDDRHPDCGLVRIGRTKGRVTAARADPEVAAARRREYEAEYRKQPAVRARINANKRSDRYRAYRRKMYAETGERDRRRDYWREYKRRKAAKQPPGEC